MPVTSIVTIAADLRFLLVSALLSVQAIKSVFVRYMYAGCPVCRKLALIVRLIVSLCEDVSSSYLTV